MAEEQSWTKPTMRISSQLFAQTRKADIFGSKKRPNQSISQVQKEC
jgi:hypothetical protein